MHHNHIIMSASKNYYMGLGEDCYSVFANICHHHDRQHKLKAHHPPQVVL